MRKEVQPDDFIIVPDEALSALNVDVANSDVVFNYTSLESQSMKGIVPWRGPREKDTVLLQMLIVALTKPRSVVLDVFASTSNIVCIQSPYVFPSTINIINISVQFFSNRKFHLRMQCKRTPRCGSGTRHRGLWGYVEASSCSTT